MKRQRTDGSLTGGTGDVSPQWMSFAAAQSAADTTTTTTQAVPVQRMPLGGRAQVMEVLKMILELPTFPATASVTEATDSHVVFLSTSSFGATITNWSEPRVFAGWTRINQGAFTAAGTYQSNYDNTKMMDLTDGAGHGILIATDNIFAQVASVGTGLTNTVRIKLLYRWKNVSLQEYIGIVQSQQ